MIDFSGFPLLSPDNYKETSKPDKGYNCTAWAACDNARLWWPTEDPSDAYWPPNAPREETVDAFVAAYAGVGFEECPGPELESGYEKVAVFANGDEPTHAARQRPDGRWTSKMGPEEDIEHDWGALDGPCYGRAVRYLRRRVVSDAAAPPLQASPTG